MKEKQLCPVCLKSGRRSYLKSFQVNLDEALWLCEYKRCIYPLGLESDPTFNRRLDDLPSEKDNPTRIPSAQLALQMQVAGRLTECHQKKQTDVIGIQTGSPLFLKTSLKQRDFKQIGSRKKGIQNGLKAPMENGANGHTTSCNKSDSITNGNSLGIGIGEKFPGLQLGTRDKAKKGACSADLVNNHIGNGHTFAKAQELNGVMHNGLGKETDNNNTPDINSINSDKRFKVDENDKGQMDTQKGVFLQWKNRNALCWLDIILCLLVHNKTLNQLIDQEDSSLKDCLIYKLIKAHRQASLLLKNDKSFGNRATSGMNGDSSVNPSHTEVCSADMLKQDFQNSMTVKGEDKGPGLVRDQANASYKDTVKDHLSCNKELNEIREEIWSFVQKKIKCEKGRPSSPVLAIPALLESHEAVDCLFRSRYKFTYCCPHCKFLEDISCDSVLPSVPTVVHDFNIQAPVHKKKCLNCSYTKGKRKMIYQSLPKSFMMHFLEGLPSSSSWANLEFRLENQPYTVTGVVQYRRNPDHFVAWLRNPEDNSWIQCDDLKSPICPVRMEPPQFPWKQVHIIMWEQGTRTAENGPTPFDKVLNQIDGLHVANDTGTTRSKVLKNGNLENSSELINAGMLINGLIKEHIESKEASKKQNNSKIEMNGNASHIGTVVPTISGITSRTSKNLCSNVSKPSTYRAIADLSHPTLDMVASKQISIDSQKFLMSASTSASLSLERSACSSISSTCSELSDNVCLPEFTSTAEVGGELVKPVPCRNDSPVQNSEFSSRNVSEADPNSCLVSDADNICDTKVAQNSHSMCSSLKQRGYSQQFSSTLVNNPKPAIKPSSVFCPPCKLQGVNGNLQQCEAVSHKTIGAVHVDMHGVKTVNTANTPVKSFTSIKNSEDIPKGCVSSKPIKEPESLSKEKPNVRFKLPALLRPKAKPSKISRDAFRIFTKTKEKVDSVALPSSPCVSPITGNTMSHLTAVKQYLLDKTTDKSHYSTKFEGLNLKSAPHLKRSVDLSGLKRNDSWPEMTVSPPSETTANNTSGMSIVSDGKLKRRRRFNGKDPSPKKLRSGEPGEVGVSNGSSGLSSVSATSLKSSASKLSSSSVLSIKDEDKMGMKGHIITCEKTDTTDLINHSLNGISQETKTVHNSKENVISSTTSLKNGKNLDSETDTVLQDLYDALNIPFSSMKAISDELFDVDDLFKTMETTNMDIHEPYKTDNFNSTMGNQNLLDCGPSMMNGCVSPHVARQKLWSPYLHLNKIILIS